ncbi:MULTISPECIES: hypothetical protein [Lysobacter]|jgi:hypothetical protein|uniref:Uncharacterized protein n=1 Tax=Lysobacter gummosus TaxID=262324 RepID=A0ABY3XBX0_9GAMM|nr:MULTISPECIES: hypothetical protein [Lysobacter]ALN89475.1 hypothetical protein LG3211_0490 [Lysobacter gummosus]UJB18607.1 hypothetical protein L1A79_20090 [Lysobacter capsici]UJQ27668.1 hypothetical protein L2D09_19795 [Lysobacter gummosus]UNP30122.1 hypothetical protein MOV92_02255 [Lysobacter gummosus]
MNRDELLGEIARLIVVDPKAGERPWDGYSLIAWYGEGISRLNGFRYDKGQPGEPLTPASVEIENRLEELRRVTQTKDKSPWRVCIVRINREAAEVAIDFEYEEPGKWYVTPDSAADIAERVRPI